MREEPLEYFVRDGGKRRDFRLEHAAPQQRKRIADHDRVAIEHEEVLLGTVVQLVEQLQPVARRVAGIETRQDADVRAERFERAPRTSIDLLDGADNDARPRQLAAKPADRLQQPQRLPEVLGIVFGDAADNDLAGAKGSGIGHRGQDNGEFRTILRLLASLPFGSAMTPIRMLQFS